MSKKNGKKTERSEDNFFYVDSRAAQFEFSDYVRASSTPHGLVLSFGRFNFEQNKFGLFQSILLPFDVAGALDQIIQTQLKELLDKGYSQINEKIEGESK